nr:hypothetical protein [Rhodoferax sp.]
MTDAKELIPNWNDRVHGYHGDDIEALSDKHYGEGVWEQYSLYLDDRLPEPLAIDF